MNGYDVIVTTSLISSPDITVGSRKDNKRRLGAFLAIAAAAAAFGTLTIAVRLGWTPLLSLDAAISRHLNALVASHSAFVRALTIVSTLGGSAVLIWLVALPVVVLVLRQRYRLAIYLALTALGAAVLDPTLKALVGRARPTVPQPIAHGGGFSFPSGHALDSLICYGAVVLVFLPALPRRRRWLLVGPAALVVILVGASRIMLGVHFVSDVIGGWSLAIAWLGLTTYAFELYRHHTGRAVPPVTEGVEPDAAEDLQPAPEPDFASRAADLRTAARLVIGWTFLVGVLIGLGVLLRHAGSNVIGDHSIPQWFAAHRTPTLTTLSDIGSRAGDSHWILGVGLVGGAVTLALTRHWRPVIFLVVVMLGELGSFLVTAKIVGRPRPEVTQLDGQLPTSAYPSGHVAATLCLYLAFALLVIPRLRSPWRWLALLPAVVMGLFVTASRLYRGMHHPTDIVASLVLTAVWLTLCYLAIRPNAYASVRPTRSRESGAVAATVG
jgi:undecaprenyl-diphosphatase